MSFTHQGVMYGSIPHLNDPLPLQMVNALEFVALGLEDAAVQTVPPEVGRHEALAAVRSLVCHFQQELLRESGEVDFIGWSQRAGSFCTVAKCQRISSDERGGPSSCPAHIAEVSDATLLEVGVVKLGAVLSGLEAACTMLRIDGCIIASHHGQNDPSISREN